MGERWERVLERPHPIWKPGVRLPGLVEWGRKPTAEIGQVLYVIWRKPWMCVSRETFIGSALEHLGFSGLVPDFPQKYPELDLSRLDPTTTLLLFSSEPYPFFAIKKIF